MRLYLTLLISLSTALLELSPSQAATHFLNLSGEITPPIVFPIVGDAEYSNDFGAPRGSRKHQGQDLFGRRARAIVVAAAPGVVKYSHSPLGGIQIFVHHAGGWKTFYGHINNDSPGTDDGSSLSVAPGIQGAFVSAGQPIAIVGDSGNAEEVTSHIHFEIHNPDKVSINPHYALRSAPIIRNGSHPPTNEAFEERWAWHSFREVAEIQIDTEDGVFAEEQFKKILSYFSRPLVETSIVRELLELRLPYRNLMVSMKMKGANKEIEMDAVLVSHFEKALNELLPNSERKAIRIIKREMPTFSQERRVINSQEAGTLLGRILLAAKASGEKILEPESEDQILTRANILGPLMFSSNEQKKNTFLANSSFAVLDSIDPVTRNLNQILINLVLNPNINDDIKESSLRVLGRLLLSGGNSESVLALLKEAKNLSPKIQRQIYLSLFQSLAQVPQYQLSLLHWTANQHEFEDQRLGLSLMALTHLNVIESLPLLEKFSKSSDPTLRALAFRSAFRSRLKSNQLIQNSAAATLKETRQVPRFEAARYLRLYTRKTDTAIWRLANMSGFSALRELAKSELRAVPQNRAQGLIPKRQDLGFAYQLFESTYRTPSLDWYGGRVEELVRSSGFEAEQTSPPFLSLLRYIATNDTDPDQPNSLREVTQKRFCELTPKKPSAAFCIPPTPPQEPPPKEVPPQEPPLEELERSEILNALDEAKVGASARFDAFSRNAEIQATEITQLQWYFVMKTTPSKFRSVNDCDASNFPLPEESLPDMCKHLPVDSVNEVEISQFVERLNLAQTEFRFTAAGIRLIRIRFGADLNPEPIK